ncbi:MAG: fatty acid cis/trans isomerase [Bradyrhizobium sp.]
MTRVPLKLMMSVAVVLSSVSTEQVLAQDKVSFARQVQPILDSKCVSCHSCYDSPGQLDLRNAKGVERGAIKMDPYQLLRTTPIEPTLLWDNPNTIEDWRKIGFFSVTDGGNKSILAKMLQLGKANPVEPRAKFPAEIEIDAIARKNVLPTASELNDYARKHPKEGMPFATAGLTDQEFETLLKWLEQGAVFDEVAAQPTPIEQAEIDKWESFLNATDDRSKLVARYIYEHWYLFHVYFDNAGTGHFFQLIRSSTPSGLPPVPVRQHLPNDPVDGPIYYRWKLVDQTLCAKQHQLVLNASNDRLGRYKSIFNETNWEVSKLPGYSRQAQMDPLNTFAAIPAKLRYKFMLADAWYYRATVSWGSSCRGNLIVGVVQDVEWTFFENPETSLYVNDEQFRAALAPYVGLKDTEDLIAYIGVTKDFIARRNEAIRLTASRLSQASGNRSRIEDIWAGDQVGDVPMVMPFRNGDNAFVPQPGSAVGDYPKTGWVLDLPIMERLLYEAVYNFDLFGESSPMLGLREGAGMSRRLAELNFLRFLPADKRLAIYSSWYDTALSRLKPEQSLPDLGPDLTLPAAINYKTSDPQREFYDMALQRVSKFVKSADPINRPQAGDNPDPVTRAMISIVAAGKQQTPSWRKFKTRLPEATFLRIDSPGKDPSIYTMTMDRELATKAFAINELQGADPTKDKITISPGILTVYPNFMFRIDEKDIEEFASKLTNADSEQQFTAVVDRWGVRRSDPQFWTMIHSATDYVRRTDPPRAAIFDVNRYKNF